MNVIEINELQQLDRFRDAWNRLLAQTAVPSFFQSWEWLQVYWRFYAGRQKLRVLLVEEGGQIAGIVPLVVRWEWTKVGPLRCLTFPLDYWGSSYGPVSPAPHATMNAAMRYLAESRRDWDAIELRWLDAADLSGQAVIEALNSQSWDATAGVFDHSPQVQLRGDWEEYLSQRGSKWRNNYRRWQRRLDERGAVRYLRYRPRGEAAGEADPRWDLFEHCESIARRSWQAQSPDGTTLCHDAVNPFLRAVHEQAARTGCLDLNLMYVDEQPIAFAYNYHFAGHVDGLRVGYDTDFRDGVGNLLYARAIEDSFARGDVVYDLGCGSLKIKRAFQTDLKAVARIGYYPRWSLQTRLLRWRRQRDVSPTQAA